jgi:PTH1 family peptidyl-tRNA hydrolase
MALRLLIALGNPGTEYEFTRHNYGWLAADYLEDLVTITDTKKVPSYSLQTARFKGKTFYICRPLTYMNLSGIAVVNIMREKKIEPDEMLVVYDDIDIPFGSIKLRSGGGDGGHKGIRSIIKEIGRNDFLRLRMGIRSEDKTRDTADYVLSPFNEEEEKQLEPLLKQASDATLALLRSEPRLVMNQVNRRK